MTKKPVKTINKNSDSFELGTLRMVIRNLYPEVTNYEEQAILIEEEFGYKTTGRDLWLLDEPTIRQEELEYELLLRQYG